MGKGYNNFMSKKAFHPGSYANQKRIQEAEEKAAAKKKHDEDTLAQYQKEQELFQQKSLVSKESKDKLSLSFMYDAPPGTSGSKKEGTTSIKQEQESSEEPIKWKRDMSVKQEKKEPKKEDPERKKKPLKDDSSSDDEPKIVLNWVRDKPKAKKVKTER